MTTARSAAVLVVDGFEEVEAVTVIDVLRRAGVDVTVVAVVGVGATGSHGITLGADATLAAVHASEARFDAVVLPGGMPGAAALRDSAVVRDFVVSQHASGAIAAAICAAPIALARFGLLGGRRATCSPGFEAQLADARVEIEAVVDDGNVITSRGVGTALPFALALVARLVSGACANDLAARMLVAR